MALILLHTREKVRVDKEDLPILGHYEWYVIKPKGRHYAVAYIDKKVVYMHRFLMKFPKGMTIDHKNGNTLDNRKANLRICTQRENNWNKGLRKDNKLGVKGVQRYGNQYRARIGFDGITKHLGLFNTAEEAATAYDNMARQYYGEFMKEGN